MSRRPAKVTQADIARALRAAQQVGPNWFVEIARDGTIRILQGDPSNLPGQAMPGSLPGCGLDFTLLRRTQTSPQRRVTTGRLALETPRDGQPVGGAASPAPLAVTARVRLPNLDPDPRIAIPGGGWGPEIGLVTFQPTIHPAVRLTWRASW